MLWLKNIASILIVSTLFMLATPIGASTLVLFEKEEYADNPMLTGILKGVRSRANDVDVRSYSPGGFYSKIYDVEESYDNVIVLGEIAIRDYSNANLSTPWIAGGYKGDLIDLDIKKRLALNIDPAEVLGEVKSLKPSIKTVHMVVTTENYNRYIETTKTIANNINIKLTVYRASNIRSTARIWFNILKLADSDDDALWIVTERHNLESGSFKYITEETWKKRIVAITTADDLALKGVAIGYIIEPESYGQQLYERLAGSRRNESNNELNANSTNKSYTRIINNRVINNLGASSPRNIDQLANKDVVIR